MSLGTYQIKQMVLDPFYTNTRIGCYLLGSDGANSAAWYTPNCAIPQPLWTRGANVSGVYQVIRAANVSGSTMIYSTGAGAPTTYDFTLSNGGWVAYSDSVWTPNARATYSAGTGWVSNNLVQTGGGSYRASEANIVLTFPSTAIASIAVTYDNTAGTFNLTAIPSLIIGTLSGATVFSQSSATPDTTGTNKTLTWTGSATIDRINVGIRSSYWDSNIGGSYGSSLIKSIVVTPAGGNAIVCYSSNYGATFGAPLTVGSGPGAVGGFDTQRAGTVSYAASAGTVCKATTLGGAYSSWYSVPSSANPVCCIIPYFKRNTTTLNTSTSTPDVLVGCDNGKLYWIDGATAVATDITPSGMTAFDNANAITVSYGHHIACFGTVSGTYHLFTSTNGGTSWTDRGALANAQFIRDRRQDTTAKTSGTNKGQCYIAQGGTVDFTSVWWSGSPVLNPRNVPVSPIGLETVF